MTSPRKAVAEFHAEVQASMKEFQAKADQCERLAKEMRKSKAKKEMLELARLWRDLAQQMERLERAE